MSESGKSSLAQSFGWLIEPVLYWLDNIGTVITLTGRTVIWLFRRPFRVQQMLAAMDFIGVQSIFIVALTGTFSGMVVTLQTTYALRAFSAEGRVGGIVVVVREEDARLQPPARSQFPPHDLVGRHVVPREMCSAGSHRPHGVRI